MLHAQADAFFFNIDVEDLHLDHVALVVSGDSFLAGDHPIQVRHVHHAINVFGEADEQSELGDVLDLALDGGANLAVVLEFEPGIGHALLQT